VSNRNYSGRPALNGKGSGKAKAMTVRLAQHDLDSLRVISECLGLTDRPSAEQLRAAIQLARQWLNMMSTK